MHTTSPLGTAVSWLAGFLFLAIGLINVFWGNDLGYGLFVILLSFVYFTPVTAYVGRRTGYHLPVWVKVLLAFFLIWSAVGVGELGDKVDMMLSDLT